MKYITIEQDRYSGCFCNRKMYSVWVGEPPEDIQGSDQENCDFWKAQLKTNPALAIGETIEKALGVFLENINRGCYSKQEIDLPVCVDLIVFGEIYDDSLANRYDKYIPNGTIRLRERFPQHTNADGYLQN